MIPGFSWAKSVGPKLPGPVRRRCRPAATATFATAPSIVLHHRRRPATHFGYQTQGTCKIKFRADGDDYRRRRWTRRRYFLSAGIIGARRPPPSPRRRLRRAAADVALQAVYVTGERADSRARAAVPRSTRSTGSDAKKGRPPKKNRPTTARSARPRVPRRAIASGDHTPPAAGRSPKINIVLDVIPVASRLILGATVVVDHIALGRPLPKRAPRRRLEELDHSGVRRRRRCGVVFRPTAAASRRRQVVA